MDKIKCLSSNALKIIGCITMVLDHIGYMFFPGLIIFRIIGRIAFPIFAFMIAEGCFYTKNRIKHFLLISILGIAMQVVEYVAADMTDFSIFIVFSFSILFIYLFDDIERCFKNKKTLFAILATIAFVVLAVGLNVFIHFFNYFDENYGYYGVMAPVVLYVVKKYLGNKNYYVHIDILLLGIMFVIRTIRMDMLPILFSFLSVPFLLMYNGKKGKYNMKYFFYIFYPAQFAVLYGIYLLVNYLK